MIRSEIILNKSGLVNLQHFIADHPKLVKETGERSFDRTKPQLMAELRHRPARSKNSLNSGTPFRWSPDPEANRRAAAWFFVHYPDGYTRTGRFERRWYAWLALTGASFQIKVANNMPGLIHVVGPMAGTLPNKPIIGHVNSGYLPVARTIDFWVEAYREEFFTEYGNLLAYLGY